MNGSKPKFYNRIVFISAYFLFILVNTQCALYFNYSIMTEWWINTFLLMASVLLLIFTCKTSLNMALKILAIPLSWIIHVILTIPAALVLGILKYNPDQIRNAAEHRSVFILASLPVVYFVLKKSRIFQE